MLKLYAHKGEVPIKSIKFPAGESLIQVDIPFTGESIFAKITLNYESDQDLIDLLLLTDAIRRHKACIHGVKLVLDIPYFPYARQDRVCNEGESLSVKVIADLINSQNYARVHISDPHSEVLPALLNNCYVISQTYCADRLTFLDKQNTVIVSPDAGAQKKIYEFAKTYGFGNICLADKHRDATTGKIVGVNVNYPNVGNKDFLIIDDICDGGRTFIELAKVLRLKTTGKLYLYVTHGIFSQGYDELAKHFDKIYVHNQMNKHTHSLLEII